MQFKLEPRLARLLGIHTQTRPVIINALWQYIKKHKLQDASEREYINCDKYLQQVKLLGSLWFFLSVKIFSHTEKYLAIVDSFSVNHEVKQHNI